jgi:hypothetical protein
VAHPGRDTGPAGAQEEGAVFGPELERAARDHHPATIEDSGGIRRADAGRLESGGHPPVAIAGRQEQLRPAFDV